MYFRPISLTWGGQSGVRPRLARDSLLSLLSNSELLFLTDAGGGGVLIALRIFHPFELLFPAERSPSHPTENDLIPLEL